MITQHEYQARRIALATKLAQDTIAIIPAAQETMRNGDSHYRFRQASDFYYLTGFNEPEAVLLIMAGQEDDSYLFNRPRDAAQEQWTGHRLGQEQTNEVLGIKHSFAIDDFGQRLPELLTGKKAIYFTIGSSPVYERQILAAIAGVKNQLRRGIKAPDCLYDLEPILSEMRLIKSTAEQALMRRAAASSVAAHRRAMQACLKATNEHQLEAELLYEFWRQGCNDVAYTPIVGSGENTCILHYNDNNKRLIDGDLVLIDAGGEFANYASDVTRTFPVNGQFTTEQRAIYQLVLKAQRAGIACIKPGVSWPQIQQTMVHILTAGLVELSLLQGEVDELIVTEAYKPFYMHNSGHWLGLDVHDSGCYKLKDEWRVLVPGMVLTVEPGLYIRAGMTSVDQRWWNIGVRIEDDILVTAGGYENLTGALPVDIAEIEALMRGG